MKCVILIIIATLLTSCTNNKRAQQITINENQVQYINNGKNSTDQSLDFVVALIDKTSGEIFCSGFAIDPSTIITASHCIAGKNNYAIYVGNDAKERPIKMYLIKDQATHIQYDPNQNREIDMGIINLVGNLDIQSFPHLATSEEIEQSFLSKNILFAGFGINEDDILTGKKQFAISNEALGTYSQNEKMISIHNSTTGTNHIDSGSPLIIQNKDGLTVLGITVAGSKNPDGTGDSYFVRADIANRWINYKKRQDQLTQQELFDLYPEQLEARYELAKYEYNNANHQNCVELLDEFKQTSLKIDLLIVRALFETELMESFYFLDSIFTTYYNIPDYVVVKLSDLFKSSMYHLYLLHMHTLDERTALSNMIADLMISEHGLTKTTTTRKIISLIFLTKTGDKTIEDIKPLLEEYKDIADLSELLRAANYINNLQISDLVSTYIK